MRSLAKAVMSLFTGEHRKHIMDTVNMQLLPVGLQFLTNQVATYD